MNIINLYKLFLGGIIISFLFSCSKPLTRDEAEKQIKMKYQFPQDEFQNFEFKEYAGEYNYFYNTITGEKKINMGDGGDRRQPQNRYFTSLQNEKLITVNRIEENANEYVNPWVNTTLNRKTRYYDIAEFTENARPYTRGNQIKIATIVFVEITGINERKESNAAVVEYTTKRVNVWICQLI